MTLAYHEHESRARSTTTIYDHASRARITIRNHDLESRTQATFTIYNHEPHNRVEIAEHVALRIIHDSRVVGR